MGGPVKIAPATFERPSYARSLMNTVQHGATGERYVTSEDELRAAIAEVAARLNAVQFGGVGYAYAAGGSITIAKTFTVSSTVLISPYCPFLTIRSLSDSMLVAVAEAQEALFEVRADHVTIDGVTAYWGLSGNSAKWFDTFVKIPSGGGFSASSLTISRCRMWVDRMFVDESADDARGAKIVNCFMDAATGSAGAPVVMNSARQMLSGCTLDVGGSGDAVTVGSDAEYCRVLGCDLGYGDYTSTASFGSNTFSGNTRVGTVTAHATDDTLGGNT